MEAPPLPRFFKIPPAARAATRSFPFIGSIGEKTSGEYSRVLGGAPSSGSVMERLIRPEFHKESFIGINFFNVPRP
jgi:hypothetical protein